MEDGATDLSHYALSDSWNENVLNDIPRVKYCIILKKVVLASISGDLKFPADPDGALETFAFLNTLLYLATVVLEVEGVVVDAAEADLDVQLAQSHGEER